MKHGHHFNCWGHIDGVRSDIITAGNYVVIGEGTRVLTHCPISFYNGKSVEIVIGNNVYIGAACVVLPGVTIGDNVVIGAGSVVSSDVPGGCIAGGNPCRKISDLSPADARRVKLMTAQKIVGSGALPKEEELPE